MIKRNSCKKIKGEKTMLKIRYIIENGNKEENNYIQK